MLCSLSHRGIAAPARLAGLLLSIGLSGWRVSIASAQPATPPLVDPIRLPTVIVTAQKEPDDVQRLPVSVTAVTADTLQDAGIRIVSEAAIYAPNTSFTEFTARKLSNARFRGIGASPANPAITTYIDGVPQLNANSSSIEYLDVAQVEFVRGPQSALFGRNALGGLINVTSRRPSLTEWTGSASVPFGNYSEWDVRGQVSGPIAETLAVGLAIGRGEREGFTRNVVTGNDLDYRSATYGKAQLLWTPASDWETRVIVAGERDRDGDYALNDLDSLRQNPFTAARDFEGFTHRDVLSTAVLARREGQRLSFVSTTGFVRWKTEDATDLDYTPLQLLTRQNNEENVHFTQEVRLSSAAAAPVRLADAIGLRWQAGVFLFTQDYEQDAINTIAPFVFSPQIGVSVSQRSPQAALTDAGLGVYGQGIATIRDRLDVTLGARFDYENKDATLETSLTPPIVPPSTVTAEDDFANLSPQVAVAYRFQPGRMGYASLARGFKAGGFNPASPPGSEAYGEELTWNVEGGFKASLADGRVRANVAAFFIDWNDLQLNVPSPFAVGQFYIANVGNASSSGVELEVNARAAPGLDVFGALGFTHARFGDDTLLGGVNVSDNKIPNTPDYTAALGAQASRALNASVSVYGRAEVWFNGGFEYDEANTEGQDAYAVANFRAGVRWSYVFAEFWIRNAFDSRYIPVAFAYLGLAPSGFIGEMGAPRRFGLNGGVRF
jgi:iron complex outermembrane receptor protein